MTAMLKELDMITYLRISQEGKPTLPALQDFKWLSSSHSKKRLLDRYETQEENHSKAFQGLC